MADWSELLPELIEEIAMNITSIEDQISFANVCSSWQTAASTLKDFFLSRPQFPYLLLAEKPSDDDDSPSGLRQVFFLTPNGEGKIQNILLPETTKSRCLSSHGWIFTVAENNIDVALVHPFTRRQIQLPRLDTFPDFRQHDHMDQYIVMKMVLSANPWVTDDFFVMVIWGCSSRPGFCKPGYAEWIEIQQKRVGPVVDINYHSGRMYTVLWDGVISSCVMDESCKARILEVDSIIPVELRESIVPNKSLFYVLGWFEDDKLLLVVREGRPDLDGDYNHKENRTSGFQVIEINLKNGKWGKVQSLGNLSLFLGHNSSICVEADGCIVKPNCIYFAEDYAERYSGSEGGGKDMGVYHLADKTIGPHFKGESLSVVSPPLWIDVDPRF